MALLNSVSLWQQRISFVAAARQDQPAVIARQLDERASFFRSPASFPATWLPQLDVGDRPRPTAPDLAAGTFYRTPASILPTWLPQLDSGDRPRTSTPDLTGTTFARSPASVLPTWLPKLDAGDQIRVPPPDLTGKAFVWFQPTSGTPISGIAWYNWQDRERLPPPLPGVPGNWFFSITTTAISGMAWYTPWSDKERLPPTRYDESKQYFRSPSSFSPTWLPQIDVGDRPRPPLPDLAGGAFVRFPVTAATPISGIAWYNWQDRERLPPPLPGVPGNWFFSITTVLTPSTWLPQLDPGDRPRATLPDLTGAVFVKAPAAAATGISGIAWQNAYDIRPQAPVYDPEVTQQAPPFVEPPLIPFYAAANADDFNPVLAFKYDDRQNNILQPIAPSVGISGIAWWQPVQVYLEPQPSYRDYKFGGWDPQFIAPPVTLHGGEWIIRARRRGRR